MNGFMMLTSRVLIALWTALAADPPEGRVRARPGDVRARAQRARATGATDARPHLLQAQVAPHFLFNTLANVQALVDAGSPQASRCCAASLGTCASVPAINDPAATLGARSVSSRAYLDLMRMWMPDRLHYEQHVDEAALSVKCPPVTLLTCWWRTRCDTASIPARTAAASSSTSGGRAALRDPRHDTGVVFAPRRPLSAPGPGDARERLQLMFGGESARVVAQESRGVCAELDVPVRA
ncbi:MAG: histidine kinase [Vicinamibacterales bacterium]